MQIRKTYKEINPELLLHELQDFTTRQGPVLDQSKVETYSMPSDSSSFITRGTLTFKTRDEAGKAGKECLRVHVVGTARGETKLMLDLDEGLFPQNMVSALQTDLDFIFGSFEVKD
jgi:hypothetical protein